MIEVTIAIFGIVVAVVGAVFSYLEARRDKESFSIGSQDRRLVAAPPLLLIVVGGLVALSPLFLSIASKDVGNSTIEPQSTLGNLPSPCGAGGLTMAGGQLFAYRAVILDLPLGHSYSLSLPDNFAGVCVIELASGVYFDAETACEVGRFVNGAGGDEVLNDIVERVTVNPKPTPEVFATPPGPPEPLEKGSKPSCK